MEWLDWAITVIQKSPSVVHTLLLISRTWYTAQYSHCSHKRSYCYIPLLELYNNGDFISYLDGRSQKGFLV